jgi:hypothetical protein
LYLELFKDFFAFFSRLNVEEIPELGIIPIMVSSPQDMSSMWKALRMGGGCKVKAFFCCCYTITSKDLATPWKPRCDSCLEKGRQICCHSDTGDEATLLSINANVQQMTTAHHFLQFEETSGLLLKLSNLIRTLPSLRNREIQATLTLIPSQIFKRGITISAT